MNHNSNLDKCVACSTCVVQCPVAEVTSKFIGPRMLGPASQRLRSAFAFFSSRENSRLMPLKARFAVGSE